MHFFKLFTAIVTVAFSVSCAIAVPLGDIENATTLSLPNTLTARDTLHARRAEADDLAQALDSTTDTLNSVKDKFSTSPSEIIRLPKP